MPPRQPHQAGRSPGNPEVPVSQQTPADQQSAGSTSEQNSCRQSEKPANQGSSSGNHGEDADRREARVLGKADIIPGLPPAGVDAKQPGSHLAGTIPGQQGARRSWWPPELAAWLPFGSSAAPPEQPQPSQPIREGAETSARAGKVGGGADAGALGTTPGRPARYRSAQERREPSQTPSDRRMADGKGHFLLCLICAAQGRHVDIPRGSTFMGNWADTHVSDDVLIGGAERARDAEHYKEWRERREKAKRAKAAQAED